MSENRFASEEFVVEVATWLERVARECSVGAPFLGRDDGTLVTASGAFFNSVGVPQGDGRPPEEQVSVGVSMPLDRLMRHCNLTEDQAIEAVELASTTPQLGVSIYVEVGPRGEQVIRLSKKIPPGDISKFGAEMDAAMKEGEWRRSRDSYQKSAQVESSAKGRGPQPRRGARAPRDPIWTFACVPRRKLGQPLQLLARRVSCRPPG